MTNALPFQHTVNLQAGPDTKFLWAKFIRVCGTEIIWKIENPKDIAFFEENICGLYRIDSVLDSSTVVSGCAGYVSKITFQFEEDAMIFKLAYG